LAIVPEKIIQDVLYDGFKYVREKDDIIDVLFSTLSQHDLQQVKEMFRHTEVDIKLGFSQEDIRLPCISIILGREDEIQPYLGNLIGQGALPYDVEAGTVGAFINKDYFFGDSTVNDGQETIGNPRKLLQPGVGVKQRLGSSFSNNYMLHIVAINPLFTLVLYHLSKFIILKYMMTFEENGIYEITLSGSDLAPFEIPIPDLCYDRTLSMAFRTTFDWFEVYDLIKMGVTQTTHDLRVYKQSPCDRISGVRYSENPLYSFGSTSNAVIGTPFTVSAISPDSITVNTETYVIIQGENLDKNMGVSFRDMPWEITQSGSNRGIRELGRDYTEGGNSGHLRLRLIGYNTGVTDVRFVHSDSSQITLEDAFSVTS